MTFREKIYIGKYDPTTPGEEFKEKEGQVEHIKKHKARIMKAFWDSGLRTSTDEYKKKAKKKAISEAKCDICGTAAYTLPKECNSEQALWGYLGLIDYIDEDGEPAGDKNDDMERYGRPVTEASPLFNGFMIVIRLTRGDVVEEKEYESSKRKVLKSGKVGVTAEVVAKMAFTDRFGENSGFELLGDAIYEGKIALRFEGGDEEAWHKGIAEAAKSLKGVDNDLLEDAIVCVGELDGYPDVPMPLIKDFKYESEVSAASQDKVEFPEMIYASCASQIEMPDGITQRIPADESIYENEGFEDWLTASVEPRPFEIQGEKVRVNVSDSSATHTVTTNVVHLVMWGEMLDPRFYHAGAYEESMPFVLPKVALVSHDEHFDCAGFLDDYEKLPVLPIFNDMKSLMEKGGYDSFIAELNKFKSDDEHFVKDYFTKTDLDVGYYTKFQKAFLENASDILKDKKYFGGHIDGSHLGVEVDNKETDTLANQWFTMHVKNKPLETVGELGHLPIGPWATIRLTGFNSEVKEGKKFKADDFWNNFNQLPEVYSAKKDDGDNDDEDDDVTIPFHPVLDYFTTRGATRGLINLNSPDPATLAMAFYDMPLDTETSSAVEDGKCNIRLTDNDAIELSSALINSWGDINSDEDEPIPFNRLSQLGFAFESDPELFGLLDVGGDVDEGSNYYREAAIRNSCGLFTTRGMTFTIIMRGEAFTPTFGRIAVSDEAGTTHATRTAIAQVWRDTEKNEDGIYPFFIQYFKILDD